MFETAELSYLVGGQKYKIDCVILDATDESITIELQSYQGLPKDVSVTRKRRPPEIAETIWHRARRARLRLLEQCVSLDNRETEKTRLESGAGTASPYQRASVGTDSCAKFFSLLAAPGERTFVEIKRLLEF